VEVPAPTAPPVAVEDAKPAKRSSRRSKAEATAEARVDAPKVEAPKPVDPKLRTVNPFTEAPTTGTLVLRSSPAAEILVDGKAIAASTPHELELSAGKHRITLVHDELDIKESFSVEIGADKTVRVNRDLTEKIKAKKRNATINPFGGGG
jgi:hypothetical protein